MNDAIDIFLKLIQLERHYDLWLIVSRQRSVLRLLARSTRQFASLSALQFEPLSVSRCFTVGCLASFARSNHNNWGPLGQWPVGLQSISACGLVGTKNVSIYRGKQLYVFRQSFVMESNRNAYCALMLQIGTGLWTARPSMLHVV